MISEDELQTRFDAADAALNLDPGSVGSVRRRADQRARRLRVASTVGVVALLAALSGAILWTRPGEVEQQVESVAAEPTADQIAEDPADDERPDGDGPVEESTTASTPTSEQDATASRTDRLTEEDFVYVGAFLVPAGDVDDTTYSDGGEVGAFNPTGDPANDDDFAGSLFLSGHPRRNPGIGELSIPEPAQHDGTTGGLPIAERLGPIVDITAGRGLAEVGSTSQGGQDEFRFGGLEVVEGPDGPRLHWSIWQYQNVSNNDVPGHGHSSLDPANPDPQGPWFLSAEDNRVTAGYVFTVPQEFADASLGGRSLMAGFKSGSSTQGRSWGPPLFAYEPPVEADIGTRLDSSQVAVFPDEDRAMVGFGKADTAGGAAWVSTADGQSALVTVGTRGLGEVFEGEPRDQDCGINVAVHAGPYEPLIMFFDPADIARAAAGEIEPWELAPYQTWNPAEHMIPTCEWELSSISFDGDSGRIYVVQTRADTSQREFDEVPVIHVFQIS